jgi:hypothetical protein
MADKLAIMERNGKISFESEQTAKVIERCQSKLEVNRSPPASAELAIPKNPTFRFWGGASPSAKVPTSQDGTFVNWEPDLIRKAQRSEK